MEEKTLDMAFKLSLVGGILILINGLWIAANNAPILYTSSPVNTVEELENLVGEGATSWWRISLGLPDLVKGPWMPLWLFLAVINLLSALVLYTKPTRHVVWSWLILICSILSIPIGGGFIIGLILGVIGGALAVEGKESLENTFAIKLVRAAKLDSKFYDMVGQEPKGLKTAAVIIILVNILSGLGNGLYIYNVGQIAQPLSPDVPFRILILGDMLWESSVALESAISFIGIALFKWLILSALIYLVGVKMTGKTGEFGNISQVVAFAYTPVCLQFFMPLILGSQPFIKWPLVVVLLTNLWMFLGLVVGLRQSLNMRTTQALGVAILAGAFYWLMNYTFIIPTFEIPYIQFTLEPPTLILPIISVSALLATALGAFTKR